MASNINVVCLTGNLTRDPELRNTPSGTAVCTLGLAVNAREKHGGEWADHASFFDVTVWGKTAENCAQYLAKGRPIAVTGRLRQRSWEDGEGNRRTAVEVVANEIQFLGGGERREDAAPATEPASKPDIPF